MRVGISISKLSGVFSILLISSVQAATNFNVEIKGAIRAAPNCEFELPEGNLGTEDYSVFTGIGTKTAWKELKIKSKGCTDTVTTMTWRYLGTAANSNTFAVTPADAGVGVQMVYHINGAPHENPIEPNVTTGSWGPRKDGGTYDHWIRFYQTADKVKSGEISAVVTIEVTYD